MAAHTPRRIFALPFIVTVASVIGCESTPPPNHPPGDQPPADEATAEASAAPTAPAPSASAAAAPSAGAASADAGATAPEPYERRWSVTHANGLCTAYATSSCGGASNCNPPRPALYPCPAELADSDYPTTLTLAGGATRCKVHVDPSKRCRPGVTCNPSPPRDIVVACPK